MRTLLYRSTLLSAATELSEQQHLGDGGAAFEYDLITFTLPMAIQSFGTPRHSLRSSGESVVKSAGAVKSAMPRNC